MNSKDDSRGAISKNILDWLTTVGAITTILAGILSLFLPEENAKKISWGIAVILAIASTTIYLYQRRRMAQLKIAESQEPLLASASLRGLLPFEDGDELPGRKRDVQDVFTLVSSRAFRFGVLCGESGCGKTSLLRAGLVPRLRNEKYLPLYINKPTKDPLEAIGLVLAKELGEAAKKSDRDLKNQLKVAALKYKKIVILFDQFEEFFLTNRTTNSRAGFIKWLDSVISDEKLPIAFLISIRNDFFLQLHNFKSETLEPTSTRTTFELKNFDTEQAKQIFSAAARADGIPFAPELIQVVIKELEVDDFVRPAELQVVGTRLKRKNITKSSQYEALGGARGILSSYINDEIKQSANEQAARLILRLMCADAVETKSPTDLSMDDILHGVSTSREINHLQAFTHLEEIQQILNQFIAARVVIHTDEDKYNLVHDYLAPYIRTATEGAETNTERANRLLKRYVAEYKEDPNTRIPFGQTRRIQKYASLEVKARDKAQELLNKSRQVFFKNLLALLGTPVIVLAILYTYLANSYYVSFEDPSVLMGSLEAVPHFVVRTGHPKLKFLPGFDNIVIQTDINLDQFSSKDLMVDILSSKFESKMTGLWYEKTETGYQNWGDQLISNLNGSSQARMRRWLNQPELAIEILIDTISDHEAYYSERSSAAQALVEFAQIKPEIVTSDLLQKLINIATNKETDAGVRLSVVNAIKELIQANPKVSISPDLFQGLIKIITDPSVDTYTRSSIMDASVQIAQTRQNALTPTIVDELVVIISDTKTDVSLRTSATNNLKQLIQNPQAVTHNLTLMLIYSSDTPVSVRSSSADILGSLAQSNPGFITPDLYQSLMKYAVDSQIDSAVRSNIQPVLIQYAQAKPQAITPDQLKIPMTFITSRYYVDPGLRTSMQNTFTNLALANPQAITTDLLQNMVDFIMYQQGDGTARSAMRNTVLTQLAQANPKAVRIETIQKLTDIFFDPNGDPFVRDWAGYTVQPLIAANPQVAAPDTLDRLLNIMADPQSINSLRVKAGYAVGPLGATNPHLVTKEKTRILAKLIIDQKAIDVGLGAADALGKFAKANPQAITSDIIQLLVQVIVNQQTNSITRSNTASALIQITSVTPNAVTPELLQTFIDFIVDPEVEAAARDSTAFNLRQLTANNPKVVTSELLQRQINHIIDPKVDPTVLSSAGYALGQLAQFNPKAVTAEMLQALVDVINDPTANTVLRSETASALGQLAQANLHGVTPEMLQMLMDIITDSQNDITIRYRSTYALGQFAQANPKLVTPELLQTFINVISDPKLKGFIADPKGDISVRASTAYTLKNLAQANPQLVTPNLLQTLKVTIADSEITPDTLSGLIYALGQSAQLNSKVATPELFQALINLITDSTVDATVRSAAMTVSVQLAQANPKIVTSERLQVLLHLITNSKAETDSSRSAALAAWIQLAEANPKSITSELLQELAIIVANSKVDTDFYLRSTAVTAVGKLSRANPQVVTSELLLTITNLVIDEKTDASLRSDLAKVLGKLTRVDSQAVKDAKTVSVLMELLQKDTDSTGRSIAAYALFEIALKDKNQEGIIRQKLSDEFLASPKPHLRIAANRLLEMMEVGALVEEASIFPDQRENIKLRLNNLNSLTEDHLKYAATIALEEINKLEIQELNNILNSQP